MRQVDLAAAQHLLSLFPSFWAKFHYDYGLWTDGKQCTFIAKGFYSISKVGTGQVS
jgi:hypothetical protein